MFQKLSLLLAGCADSQCRCNFAKVRLLLAVHMLHEGCMKGKRRASNLNYSEKNYSEKTLVARRNSWLKPPRVPC